MSAIEKYLSKLKAVKAANSEWDQLASRIENTGKFFRSGQPSTFMLEPTDFSSVDPARRSYAQRTAVFRKGDWPSAAAVAKTAQSAAKAREEVARSWDSLSPDQRFGLESPPTYSRY